jgi:predicted RNA-binding Zn-ribbon protein involved in translation (DUF1610 family)
MMDGGVTRTVPAEDFGHDGFDELIDWIAGQVKTAKEVHRAREIEKTKGALQAQIDEIDRKIVAANQDIQAKTIAAQTAAKTKAIVPTVVASIVVLFLLAKLMVQVQTVSVPIHWSGGVKWGFIMDDVVVTNNDSFGYSNVRIKYTMQPAGRSPVSGNLSADWIPPHTGHTFPNEFSLPSGSPGNMSLECAERTKQEAVPIWGWIALIQLALSGILYGILCQTLRKPETAKEFRQLADLAEYKQRLQQQLQNVHLQPPSQPSGDRVVLPPLPQELPPATVVTCRKCGRKLRVPVAGAVRPQCPNCKNEFEQRPPPVITETPAPPPTPKGQTPVTSITCGKCGQRIEFDTPEDSVQFPCPTCQSALEYSPAPCGVTADPQIKR